MHMTFTQQTDTRTAALRKLRDSGYPASLRRKWWGATAYLRERGLWVLDGAPARWGAGSYAKRS